MSTARLLWVVWRTRWLVALALTLVTAAAFLASGYHRWLGSSRVTFGEAADLGSIICVAPAIVAAFLASAFRRRGEETILGVTVRQRGHLVALTFGVGLAGAVGLAIATAGAVVLGAVVSGNWQVVGALRMLPVFAACFAYTACGAAIGRVLPWPPMAGLLAPLGWFVYAVSIQIQILDPLQLYQGLWSPTQRLSPILLGLQTIALVAAMFLVLGLRSRRSRAKLIRWLLVGTIGVCAGAMIGGGSEWISVDAAAAAVTCQINDGVVKLCLPKAEDSMRSRLAGFLKEAVDSTRSIDPSFADPSQTVFAANDADPPSMEGRVIDVTARYGPTFAMFPNRNDTLVQMLPEMINPKSCAYADLSAPTDTQDQRFTPSTMGAIWLWQLDQLNLHSPGYGVPAAAEFRVERGSLTQMLENATDSQRERWFGSHWAQISACQQVAWDQ